MKKHRLSKRRYQLGIKVADFGGRAVENKKFYNLLLHDYGAASGAVIGALGTVIAGWLALVGVQEQIKHQSIANLIAEQAYLSTEMEKSLARIANLSEISHFMTKQVYQGTFLDNRCNRPHGEIREAADLDQFLFEELPEIPESFKIDLKRGSGGKLGVDIALNWDSVVNNQRTLVEYRKAFKYQKNDPKNLKKDTIEFYILGVEGQINLTCRVWKDIQQLLTDADTEVKYERELSDKIRGRLKEVRTKEIR